MGRPKGKVSNVSTTPRPSPKTNESPSSDNISNNVSLYDDLDSCDIIQY